MQCNGDFIVSATSVRWTMSSDQYLAKFQESSLCSHIYIWLIKPIPLFNYYYYYFFYRITLSTDLDLSFLFFPEQDIPKPCNSKGCNQGILDFLSCDIKASLICLCCVEKKSDVRILCHICGCASSVFHTL